METYASDTQLVLMEPVNVVWWRCEVSKNLRHLLNQLWRSDDETGRQYYTGEEFHMFGIICRVLPNQRITAQPTAQVKYNGMPETIYLSDYSPTSVDSDGNKTVNGVIKHLNGDTHVHFALKSGIQSVKSAYIPYIPR